MSVRWPEGDDATVTSSAITPGIPPSPTVEALRRAVDAYTAWPPPSDVAVVVDLVEAAQAIVREHDDNMARVKLMMAVPRPTAAEIRAQLGLPRGRSADEDAPDGCICPEDAHAVRCPVHRQAPPSVREIVEAVDDEHGETRRDGR